MSHILATARYEFLIARRSFWVATAIALMSLFSVVLTLAGTAPSGQLGVDPLTIALTSITTLSMYLVPLIALLLSYDAIAGERERGTLALSLSYPISRGQILIGKFLAHLTVLGLAIAIGLGAAVAVTVLRFGELSSLLPVARLFVSALGLGAAFLGFGYVISAIVRAPSAASGLAIMVWLVAVVLYDLGLLGALVADQGGFFTRAVFPWLLVANPADAFRLINMPDVGLADLSSGFQSAGGVSGTTGQILSLGLWPVVALLAGWALFRKVDP